MHVSESFACLYYENAAVTDFPQSLGSVISVTMQIFVMNVFQLIVICWCNFSVLAFLAWFQVGCEDLYHHVACAQLLS